MGPSAQKHSLDDFNADNFDHGGQGFIRGAQISVTPADLEAGPIGAALAMNPPPGIPRWGAAFDFPRAVLARHAALVAQTENLPLRRPDDRSRSERARQFGLAGAAPDLRLAAAQRSCAPIEFLLRKLEELGRAMGATRVWRRRHGLGRAGRAPRGRHAHGQRSQRRPW